MIFLFYFFFFAMGYSGIGTGDIVGVIVECTMDAALCEWQSTALFESVNGPLALTRVVVVVLET